MKIQYLGTAAAEGIPAIFCDCETCKKSRAAGKRNIRTRSQALVDDTLLIDFPPDTYLHFLQHNMPLTKIKSCIITHSHEDHLYIDDIAMRKDGFAHIENKAPLSFYSDEASYNIIKDIKARKEISDDDVLAVLIKPFVPFEVDGYKVTALRAAHTQYTSPVVYIIEKDGKSLFYSNDTSEYPEDSMAYLENIKKPLSFISFDCTEACNDANYVGHLTLKRCVALREKLLQIGAADSNTIFVLNHFSHNGKDVLYDDFVKIAAENDFEVSYDGMIMEF